MRVGIMGGTLDPVHNGHMMLARAAWEELRLDKVWLLPSGDPPHKCHIAPKEHRLNMCRLAANGLPWLEVSDFEICRPGVTYTADTLQALHEMQPETEWVYLIGVDTLNMLESWRAFERVARLCSFAVLKRADESFDREQMLRLQARYGAVFEILPQTGPAISSTEIRRRIAEAAPIGECVPSCVEEYIREHGLYLCDYALEELAGLLSVEISPARLEHTLGVAQTAKRLAKRFGIGPMRAELAALLHDCAKSKSREELRELALRASPPADEAELSAPQVLHAPAGSVLAAERYGVRDKELLSAIRKHTLGDAHMTALEALIYVADFIEPGREGFEGLEEVRELAERDIMQAARRCARLGCDYLQRHGRRAHLRTLSMMEGYPYNSL